MRDAGQFDVEVDAAEAFRGVDLMLAVCVRRGLRFRLAMLLFRLAAWLLGVARLSIKEKNGIVIETLGNGSPPLLLVSERLISDAAIANVRAAVVDALARNAPVVLIEDMDVYQLIEGQWRPLKPSKPPTQTVGGGSAAGA